MRYPEYDGVRPWAVQRRDGTWSTHRSLAYATNAATLHGGVVFVHVAERGWRQYGRQT